MSKKKKFSCVDRAIYVDVCEGEDCKDAVMISIMVNHVFEMDRSDFKALNLKKNLDKVKVMSLSK